MPSSAPNAIAVLPKSPSRDDYQLTSVSARISCYFTRMCVATAADLMIVRYYTRHRRRFDTMKARF